MTKKEAVENHRKMWRWIAEETLLREAKVHKKDYFEHFKIASIPFRMCYLCDYVNKLNIKFFKCRKCPVNWGKWKTCYADHSLYYKWYKTDDYELCAKYAKEISELEERETKKFDSAEVDK